MTVTQPIAAPAWQPAPPRPPLSDRERAGARLAGILGYLVLSVGFALFGIPVALLIFAAFFALIFGILQRANNDPELGGFTEFVRSVDPGAWILPLVVVALVGVAVMVAALLVSRGILRAHGVNRPWGVTFAGAGIAIVASWIASVVLSLPLQLTSSFSSDIDTGVPFGIILGALSVLVGLATTAVVGMLSWWWMAHLMRPAARTP